eukprot:GHVP01034198.1.p1 GENE.GHVP01034198.1~~GHVP01034198.1.p1  ORF type:complete len:393 (+),score=85.88 GHVP01034198.1:28-1206(+)
MINLDVTNYKVKYDKSAAKNRENEIDSSDFLSQKIKLLRLRKLRKLAQNEICCIDKKSTLENDENEINKKQTKSTLDCFLCENRFTKDKAISQIPILLYSPRRKNQFSITLDAPPCFPNLIPSPIDLRSNITNPQYPPTASAPQYPPTASAPQYPPTASAHQYPTPSSHPTEKASSIFSSGAQVLKAEASAGNQAAADALSQLRNHESKKPNSQIESSGGDEAKQIVEILGGEIREDVVTTVLGMRLEKQTVSEKEIVGLLNVKKLIRDKIINPVKRPDLHQGLHQAPRGILLFGPPGTGKTMLAKWMASESGTNFFEVTPSALIYFGLIVFSNFFKGDTETLVKTLFKVADVFAPSIIFIDEIDSLLGKRRDKEVNKKEQFSKTYQSSKLQ